MIIRYNINNSITNGLFSATKRTGMLLLLLFIFLQPTSLYSNQKHVSKTVTGLVRNAHSKKAINAAHIQLINHSATATSDENGRFSIQTESANAVLHVSAYGYATREVAIRGLDSVVVDLYPESFSDFYKKIDGFNGDLNNSTITSSYKGIEEINQSAAISPDEALQSVFGADLRAITRSAVSGMGAALFIRGINSINANAQPLFVVDGVLRSNMYDVSSIHGGFFANPLSDIDVSDIESISLLKDGTSMYGSRGANGVILIKTKRAKGLATKINLNIATGITTAPQTIPVMDANQYKIYVTDMLGSAGLTNSEIAQLPFLNDDPSRSNYKSYHNNTNWTNEVYQTGVTQNYSINVKGGDEKALYYFALGYTTNDAVVKTTDFSRYNMRLNADVNLTEKITLGANVGFSRIDRTLVDDGVNDYSSPTWLSLIKSPFLSPTNFTSLGEPTAEFSYADIFNVGNPGAVIAYSNNTLKQNNFNISLKPVFRITKNLTLTNQFDYNVSKINEDFYRPYLYAAPIFIQGVGLSYNARMSQVMRNTTLFNDFRLNYSKQFDVQKLNVLFGTRYMYEYLESDYAEGHNSMSNSSINLMGGFSDIKTDGMNNEHKTLSHYLTAAYSFDSRYFVDAAVSVDGSSRFGNLSESGFSLFGHRWAVFPSVNAAWLLSSETFMKNFNALNLLKIRAGYGLTGNDNIPDYQTQTYFSSVRLKGVSNGLIISNLANSKIQWENTARANAGIDLSVLNERLMVSLDLYSSVTSDLLVQKDLQDVAGLDKYWTNDGKLSNKGVELALNAKILNLKNFGWELGVSAGHYKNEILELNSGSFVSSVYGAEVLSAVGYSAGVFYGYKTNAVFATAEEAASANLKVLNNAGIYTAFGAGDVVFDDKVADGIIDEQDKQVIGNPNPDLYGSLTNKFSYGNFSLSTLFTYSYGNDVYNYQRRMLESGLNYNNQSLAMLSRWTSEGQQTSQPKAVYGDPMGNARFSDRWIEDGSYIRLKTVSLAYDVPLKSNFIQGLNVWFSANNLFTLTNYLGADPEFSAQNGVVYQGVDVGLLPLSKSYFIGFKFNL